MSIFNKFAAIILSVLIVSLAVLYFIDKITSADVETGVSYPKAEAVKSDIQIFRNKYGIPHVVAKNQSDAYFSLGYLHAADRLWQMDILRRTASGRLSEVFGKTYLENDHFMRCLGIDEIADKIYSQMPDETKSILDSYAAGVNYVIQNEQANYSFEFSYLEYKPELWRPTDCILVQRLSAFRSSSGFITDLIFGDIADKKGIREAIYYIPQYPYFAPCVYDEKSEIEERADKPNFQFDLDTNEYENLFEFNSDLSQTVRTARNISGVRGTSAGSNVWVMKKTIGDRSGVVLANDPHSSLNLPAQWYQVHISCPEFNTVGLTSPGIPGFYIGRNDSIVWGVADIKIDDCDYFIEKTDSAHSDKYIDMTGESRKFKYLKDTIKIEDEINFVFYKRYTERSIVISDTRIANYLNMSESDILNKFVEKYCITYRWTGTEVTDEISSLIGISASRSMDEFDSALLSWGAPAVNFVFADKDANISVISAGIVPNRNEKCNLILPNPGRYEEFGWKDDFNIIVSDVGSNPEKNYIIAANNKLSRDHDEFLSYYWEPSSRADRINELLKEFINADDDEYTSIDARRMQNDVMSAYASDLLKVLIPVLIGNQNNMNEQEKQALILLAEWDNNLFPHTAAPTIYTSLLERLLYNTFADELGDELYNEYSMISGFAGNKLAEIVNNKRDMRFDDVNTEEKEVRDYIILKSFREALGRLNLIYPDSDIKDWKYGAVHGYILRHKLSGDKLLEGTVTVGPIEAGGDNTTINNGERNYNKHFEALTGATVRFISDSEEEYIYTSIPGGSSGNPLSKHYQDQIYLWHNGGYLTLSVSAVPDETFELKTLIRKSGQTE